MLRPTNAKTKAPKVPNLTDPTLVDHVTRAAERVRSLAGFFTRTISRRRWWLVGALLYAFFGRVNGFTWPLLMIPPFLALAGYASWYSVRRTRELDLRGMERETWRQQVLAWWTARRRVDRFLYRWPRACEGYELRRGGPNSTFKTKAGRRHTVTIPVHRVRATLAGDVQATAYPGRVQVRSKTVRAAAADLAEAMGCKEVMVAKTATNGILTVNAFWTSPLERVIRLNELPLSPDRNYFAYAVLGDGTPMLARKNRSILFGGMTGGGKSTLIWASLASMLADGEWVDLYVSDGKSTEMTALAAYAGKGRQGRLRVVEYSANGADTEKVMLPKVMARLAGRRNWMAEHEVREITKSSQENPYVIVIVDELTLIPGQLKRDGATSQPLGQILTGGRAALFVAWMATQDGHTETIPGSLRSLIPTRVCFATDTPMSTAAILGVNAEVDRGAACSRLDPVKDAGVCYAGSDRTRVYDRARVPLVTDAEVARLARGKVPDGMLDRDPADAPRRCSLYRVWEYEGPDGTRRLGYIGEAFDHVKRFAQHRDMNRRENFAYCPEHQRVENWWVEHVDEATAEVVKLPTKRDALREEELAIRTERPYWNRKHNWDNRWAAVNRHLPRRRRGEPLEIPAEATEPQLVLTGPVLDAEPVAPRRRRRQLPKAAATKPAAPGGVEFLSFGGE